jgi:predicted regulator of Ras-like GTPase activity (Roadblock/LC7/MglB family)
MPDKDGYEICDFVKRHPRLARTPVLLMSGIVNDEVRERAARVHSADVLGKPFAADDLLRRLEALLAVARPPAPPVPPPVPPVRPAAPPAPPAAPMASPAAPPAPPAARTAVRPASLSARPAAPEVSVEPSPEPVVVAPPEPAPLLAPAINGANGHGGPHVDLPAPPSSGVAAALLEQLAAFDGVQWVVLADREGFLLEAAGDDVIKAEVAGALSACLAESTDGLGRELSRGALSGMILEYEQGMVVLYGVGASALLAIALTEPTALGKVRYFAKKAVPELLQAL